MIPTYEPRTIADIEEFEKVPFEERCKITNTYDLLKAGAAIDPDAVAISFFLSGETYSSPQRVLYRELIAKITQAANFFHDLGVRPGDVISFLLPNFPETHYVLWGAEAAGIVNPLNLLLGPSVIRDVCQTAKTKLLVCFGEMQGVDFWQKVDSVRKDITTLKAVVKFMGPGNEKEGIYSFEEHLPRYRSDRLDSGRVINADDVASMYLTGGTTGVPKLAIRTHMNEAAMAHMMAFMMTRQEGVEKEAIICGLPLFHVNAATITGTVPFFRGNEVVLATPMGYRDPSVMKNFYKIIEYYRVMNFSAVPTILSVLLDTPIGDADISSLRFTICGAAPLSVELCHRYEAHTGMKVLEGYGLTEGTCVSTSTPLMGEHKIGSIGLRLAYQQMKIFICDEEGRFVREAGTDEIGEVCIKGPNVFKGYADESQNARIWPKPGWFNTGDLGRQDKDGYFWLTGRKKDLMIRGGHNIDPAMIEEPLYKMQEVKIAAVVGSPDPHAGEIPIAYVELNEGAHIAEEQILEHLRKEVPERAAVPKQVVIMPQMPLTPIGKVFKPALRRDSIRRVYAKELLVLGGLVEKVDVAVDEDKIHGALATVEVTLSQGSTEDAVQALVKRLLGRYTCRYRLIFK